MKHNTFLLLFLITVLVASLAIVCNKNAECEQMIKRLRNDVAFCNQLRENDSLNLDTLENQAKLLDQ